MALRRLAVISHSAVLEINQAVYRVLAAAHPELELRLIVPQRWRNSLTRGKWLQAAGREGVRPLPVRLAGQINLHWYGPGLERALRAFRPEVLLVIEEPYSLAAGQATRLARKLGTRLAVYTNQNLLRRYPPPFAGLRARVLGQAERMLVPTEACAEVLRELGYQRPIHHFPYPFALPEAAEPNPYLSERLGLQPPVVGYVGRLEPEKGLLDLLAAAQLLRERGRSIHLLLVGEGPQRAELERRAAADLPGQVHFTGYVPHDQVAPYFLALDVLALPSRTTPAWKEQFGRVLLEAWGYGVPVVGSDSGHIPLLIRETGGGLVFREGDSEDLAERLEILLRDPERSRAMAQTAREVVRREYSLERVAERL